MKNNWEAKFSEEFGWDMREIAVKSTVGTWDNLSDRLKKFIKKSISKAVIEERKLILKELERNRDLHKHRAETHKTEVPYKSGKYIGWRDACGVIKSKL